MNIVICDDEEIFRTSLTNYIRIWAEKNNCLQAISCLSFSSSEDLLDKWNRGLPIDLLFLDIEIPGELSGMNAANRIFNTNPYIPIVFVTHYREFALEGYHVNALRYLTKPILQKDIEECMNIVWRQWSLAQNDTILIQTAAQTLVLPQRSIIYLQSHSHLINIVATNDPEFYQVRCNFKELLSSLPKALFVQCHRSYAINLMYIRKFQRSAVQMSDGKTIPVGRSFSDDFCEAFYRYCREGGA